MAFGDYSARRFKQKNFINREEQRSRQLDDLMRRRISIGSLDDLTNVMGATAFFGPDDSVSGAPRFFIDPNDGSTNVNADDLKIDFWASLGLPSNAVTRINTMWTVGNHLYVGGLFTAIGGIQASNIAYYDLTTGVWYACGAGTDAEVYAIAAYGTDGVYASVYIGGAFLNAGGAAHNRIAVWDDATLAWTALGTGLNNDCYGIHLAAPGEAYVTGAFTTAGGGAASRVAKWAAGWSALGSGITVDGNAITGDGTYIYVVGNFASLLVAKWNGTTWSALGTDPTPHQHGYCIEWDGTYLYVGGDGGRVDRWDGASWSTLVTASNDIHDIAIIGTDLYICGEFTNVTGTDGETIGANRIARLSGTTWNALGSGVNNSAYAMAVSGTNLYVGGFFTAAGGRASQYIAGYLSTMQSVLAYLEISGQALQDGLINGTVNFDGSLRLKEQSSLSTPPSGYGKVGFKNDNLLYMMDDAGNELPAYSRWIPVRKTTNEIRNSTTTLTVDSQLTVTLPINSKLAIRGRIYFKTTINAGFKYRTSFGGTPVEVYAHFKDTPNVGGTNDTVYNAAITNTIIHAAGGATFGYIEIFAVIHTESTTPRIFQFQWAQATSHADNTVVLAGSYMEYMFM